jgi:hypothetical protein
MSITHKVAVRTVLADAVCNSSTGQLAANGKIIIYSGTPPANADAALSGNVAIATITGLNFGAAASGVSTVSSSTADPGAVGGTAAFFRITTTGGTVVLQGACATSASDLNLNSLTIAAGATVSLNAGGTYTAPL